MTMRLDEILSSPSAIRWKSEGSTGGKAQFTVGDNDYTVWIDRIYDEYTQQAAWEILFFLEERDTGELRVDTTGTGGQFQVYSTVFGALLDHMRKYGQLTVKMVAEDPSRRSLYPKMLRRVFPGWEIEVTGEDIYARMPNQYPEEQ